MASPAHAGPRKVAICDVNPHIVCSLCAGYFIDATTITECLHTFCRACIVKHFQFHKTCPTCNVKAHDTQPLSTLRSDRTMQDIVYKLVPNLQLQETQRSEEYFKVHGIEHTGDRPAGRRGTAASEVATHIAHNDECLSLKIEKHPGWQEDLQHSLKPLTCVYIRCSAHTTMLHLKKYLTQRMSVPPVFEVDLLCSDIVLNKDYTLKFVWLAQWQKKRPPLIIHYRLKELYR